MMQPRISTLMGVAFLLAAVCGQKAVASEQDRAQEFCAQGKVLSIWRPAELNLRVRVEPTFDRELDGCRRTLLIENPAKSDAVAVLLKDEFAEGPIAIWPLGERVLTLWESGSAFLVVVYGYEHGHIKKVLEERPKGIPELTFCEDGRERIVLTHDDEKSAKAEVYVWSKGGGKYAKPVEVPWKTRLSENLCN
jgi:hypothetical protein